MIKFIDLFAGIGGFHQALKNIGGFECVFASELDKDASYIYELNHGIKALSDITKIHEKQIPPHDLICAGFPCQPFSKSGYQQGFDDIRGTLFFDIIRIAKEHKPKIILLENVSNISTHDNGNTI
jgi:DNA (cytosine-5)-methyltransferase 1